VLVINMARAPQRWAMLRETMHTIWPDAPVRRVEATDGAALTERELAALVAPGTQVQLRDPHSQGHQRGGGAGLAAWRVCDPLVLDSPGALGASCSHAHCWELAAAPDAPECTLVLEDDACPSAAHLPPDGACAPGSSL
jgi:GR25 family glycosyltransferase involved in LPS biosynthesis